MNSAGTIDNFQVYKLFDIKKIGEELREYLGKQFEHWSVDLKMTKATVRHRDRLTAKQKHRIKVHIMHWDWKTEFVRVE